MVYSSAGKSKVLTGAFHGVSKRWCAGSASASTSAETGVRLSSASLARMGAGHWSSGMGRAWMGCCEQITWL